MISTNSWRHSRWPRPIGRVGLVSPPTPALAKSAGRHQVSTNPRSPRLSPLGEPRTKISAGTRGIPSPKRPPAVRGRFSGASRQRRIAYWAVAPRT